MRRRGLGADLSTINSFGQSLTQMAIANMAAGQFIVGEGLAESQAMAAELGPGCSSMCEGLELAAPAPGTQSEFDRCVDNCIAGVADPADLARRQAACNRMMDHPDLRALFPAGATELWGTCVENPQNFMDELQNVGVPVPDEIVETVAGKPWYKRPAVWIIGGAAIAAGLIVLR